MHDVVLIDSTPTHAVNMANCHILEQAYMELGMNHTDSNAVLTVVEIESTLRKIFQLARENCGGLFEAEKATELTLNWILKCYDRYNNVA